MTVVSSVRQLREYLGTTLRAPRFYCADARELLRASPRESTDCCITSPPYWGKRKYAAGGIGLEGDYRDYISALLGVFAEVKRVLKPTGSLWLNLGDTYERKRLLGLPWRMAMALTDEQGWILRNSVIWNKVKGGPDNAKDKLRNVHENLFHFVKIPRGYYYDADAIRTPPREARVVNGAVVSATGVTGIRYKRQIELSTCLTDKEKKAAFKALNGILDEIKQGRLSDFRMIIRGRQRTTHSDAEAVSGRARELTQNGFYFLRYDAKGSKPSDVWDILPEDTQKRDGHFAAFPEELCRIPILATCPPDGVVLDAFCGTGTTMLAACRLGRKSIGIDISKDYIAAARKRCKAIE